MKNAPLNLTQFILDMDKGDTDPVANKKLAEIVDAYCRLNAAKNELDKEVKKLRAEILRKSRSDRVNGNEYFIIKKLEIARTLNTDLLKTEYGLQWYDDHCMDSERVKFMAYKKPEKK